MHRYQWLVVLSLISGVLLPMQEARAASLPPAFVRRWALDDAPVASGEEQQSWTWGPRVLRSSAEPYHEAPGGQREVWYLDKARMEITRPGADPNGDWFVTTGLLVRELISGEMQVGDRQFERWQSAAVPVAGDLDVPLAQTITYADLRRVATIVPGEHGVPQRDAEQGPLLGLIGPGGMISQDQQFAAYDVRTGGYDDRTRHNIAQVFLQTLSAEHLLYIAGRPLTEPYWARVRVAGQQRDVLLQAFERRVLTYTPSNPDGWKVEWGNVGRQYVQWRYGQTEEHGFAPDSPTVDAQAVVQPLAKLSPGAAALARDRQALVGVAVLQTDTGAFFSFQGTRTFPMYSTAKVPIMLAVLDRAVREDRRVSQRERGLIEAMIQQSDNNAASILLAEVGGADHVTSYLRGIGLDGTEINGYAWGASTTTAQDMARLMAKIGNCTILVPRLCRYALQTMQNVARSQKWGVSAGVPAGAAVALKNGWYPQPSGWGINSVGLVTGAGKQYAIAIYTNPNPSMAYGVETIERISAEVYPAVR